MRPLEVRAALHRDRDLVALRLDVEAHHEALRAHVRLRMLCLLEERLRLPAVRSDAAGEAGGDAQGGEQEGEAAHRLSCRSRTAGATPPVE